MIWPSSWLRVLRAAEAAPFGGVALLGGALFGAEGEIGLGLLLPALAAFGIAAFAFLFNDLQDSPHDRHSPTKAQRPLVSGALPRSVAWGVVLLLAGGSVALLVVFTSSVPLALGVALLILGLAYSWRPTAGKVIPVASSLLHLAGGTGTFVLGAWWLRPGGWQAPLVGIFFGLVFAAGHLHQEAQDAVDDRAAGVLTHAVRFGARPVLWAGFVLWCASSLHFSVLAAAELIPPILGIIQGAAFAVYAAGFYFLMRGAPSGDRIARLRRLYRVAYLTAGLAMLAVAVWSESS